MILTLIELIISGVLLIPIFLIFWKIEFHNPKRTIAYFIFAIYLASVYHFVGLPTIQFIRFDIHLNLIPLIGMVYDLRSTLLNILLFVPLGFFLPMLWVQYREQKQTILFGLGITTAIELMQLFTYRVTDINDIITNVFGTFLGFCLFRFTKWTRVSKNSKDIFLILGVVFLTMFFIQPKVMNFIYKII